MSSGVNDRNNRIAKSCSCSDVAADVILSISCRHARTVACPNPFFRQTSPVLSCWTIWFCTRWSTVR